MGLSATNTMQSAVDAQANLRLSTRVSARGGTPLWLQLAGNSEKVSGRDGYSDVFDHSFGMLGGWDAVRDEHSLIGVSAGYLASWFRVDGLGTDGRDRMGTVSAYGAFNQGRWFQRFVLTYGLHRMHYDRVMAAPGATETASANVDANSLTALGTVAHAIPLGRQAAVRAFATVSVNSLWIDGFGERSVTDNGDAGVLALGFEDRNIVETRSLMGGEFAGIVDLGGNLRMRPSLTLSWLHNYNPQRSAIASFLTAPDFNFETGGAEMVRDLFRGDLGLSLGGNGFEFMARIGGAFGPGYSGGDAQVGVRAEW